MLGFLSYSKKRNVTRDDYFFHSLSLFAICCPSLPFVVTRYTTRFHSLLLLVLLFVICCHLLYHLLSLLVTRYHSMYQSSVFYKRLLCALKLDRLSKEDQYSLVLEDFKATCYLKQTREIVLIHECIKKIFRFFCIEIPDKKLLFHSYCNEPELYRNNKKSTDSFEMDDDRFQPRAIYFCESQVQ